jgi:hypothetical protein
MEIRSAGRAALAGFVGLVCAVLPAAEGRAAEPSYAGQELREIKALSADEVRALRAGEGMGLAKAAELNRYPGPRHVLDAAEALGLTAEQRAETERIYGQMHAEATALGQEILALERELDTAFAQQTIREDELARLTGALGALQGRLRASHLRAHLQALAILTAGQMERYRLVRGYAGPAGEAHHGHRP